MLKVAVSGASGKMGKEILSSMAHFEGRATISGALESTRSQHVGKDVCSIVSCPAEGINISSDVSEVLQRSDVLIEFTSPEATIEHLEAATKQKKPMVIGTTGLTESQTKRLEEASKTIPIVFAPNMSVGVNILFKIIKEVTAIIGDDFDIEITEAHHHRKKDAPSGTAKKMAEIISETLGRKLDEVGVYGRKGMVGARKKEEIGIHALRAGDIVGDHTALFAGPGERIEITHRAHSRATFAIGSIKAALFIAKKEPGLYSMKEVLGL